MEYLVQWRYRSGLGGPWTAGMVVNLPAETAEMINRDSPGVLVAVLPEILQDAQPVPRQDRMVRRAQGRKP